ncbi:hypothetical protein N9O24_00780, partial [bacterium]|nr:hypothetical protein [bacterium]
CECGLLQCGCPYHDIIITHGVTCLHKTYHETTSYNPTVADQPQLTPCRKGDEVSVLVNAAEHLYHGLAPDWRGGKINTVCFEGILVPELIILLCIDVTLWECNSELQIRMSLWEPGITSACMRLGGRQGTRAIVKKLGPGPFQKQKRTAPVVLDSEPT